MAKRGRKSKFSGAHAQVLKDIRAGVLIADAAEHAGVSRSTLYEWLKQGSEAKEGDPLREFADAYLQRRASAKIEAVHCVHRAMKKNWRAAAWWLGVTDPKNYGLKVRITLEEEFSSALRRIAKRLPEDVYEQVLDAILEDGSDVGEGPPAKEEEPFEQ